MTCPFTPYKDHGYDPRGCGTEYYEFSCETCGKRFLFGQEFRDYRSVDTIYREQCNILEKRCENE